MKRVIAAIFAILFFIAIFGIFLSGCRDNQPFITNRFQIISVNETLSKSEKILYDKNTNITYLWVQDDFAGGLCPLYNSDGSLMVYEGE